MKEAGRNDGGASQTTLAEAALQDAQSLHSLILNSSHDCTVVLDLDGNNQFISPGGIESMEISDVDAILGLSWLRVWQGADHEAACAAVATARAGGIGRFQGFCATHRGTPKWWDVVISPLRGRSGLPERLVSVGRDITALRQAEEALARNADRLRLALDTSGLGDWEVDLANGTSTASTRLQQIFGYAAPLPTWSYETFLQHVIEDDRERVDTSLRQARRERGSWVFECRIRRADGDVRWIEGRAQPIDSGGSGGSGERLLGVIADVTERKLSEASLAQSEARFQAITNSIEQMVWSTTPDGLHDYYNQRWYDYTGVPAGSTDGEVWSELFHPDDQSRAWAVWRDSLATGDPYHIEYRLRHRSGKYRWVLGRAHALRGQNGEITRWFGTCTDIQEIMEAREVLSRSREDLEQRVEQRTRERDRAWKYSRDLQVVVGSDGRIRSANEAWFTILGWTPAEVVGRNHLDFSSAGDRTSSEEALTAAFRKPLAPYEHRAVHKDGSERLLSWVFASEGDLVYASGRDVTAEKEAALALSDTQEQLRQAQKMEAVGQLTGGLAHDFNNLLMGISGSLELLSNRLAQGRLGEVDRHVTAAQAAARRAASLTHRLLAFSRRQTLDPKPTDVDRLIRGMDELIRRTVGPGIELEVVTAAGSWITDVDPNQLENAVLNLCINARDAMPDGGRLTIETANKWMDERGARDRDLPPGQYLSICVTDTGTGMTPQVIERAFDPFFTTKPIGMGTGLGLSMVYGFARQSAGQVRIYSEVGHGTTMCIYLPRHAGAESVAEAVESRAEAHAGQAETVLVVDDEATVRNLIVEVLGEQGYTTLEAGDGADGLAILRSGVRIDLLITDVGLPGGMNGRQLADAARVERPELTVLFITGFAENAVVGNGHLEHGMHVLTKPFSLDLLSNRIRDLIKRP